MLLDSGTLEFTNLHSAQGFPLAAALFNVSGVARVKVGTDFIMVTKTPDTEKDALVTACSHIIDCHLSPLLPKEGTTAMPALFAAEAAVLGAFLFL